MVCRAGYSVIQTLGILLDIREAKNTRLSRDSCMFFTLLESLAITCSILSTKPFGIDIGLNFDKIWMLSISGDVTQ